MHPYISLVYGYAQGHVTTKEFRNRARLLRLVNPPEMFWNKGSLSPESYTPTDILADWVSDQLDRIDKELQSEIVESALNNGRWGNGAVNKVSYFLAGLIPCQEESAARLLWRIVGRESEMTKIDHADKVVSACDGDSSDLHELPFFSLGEIAAREQVEAYLDRTGERMGLDEREELAHKLLRFSIGIQNSARLTGDEHAFAREQRRLRDNAKKRARKARQKTAEAELVA
jgi:hypothetical protein